MFKSSAIILLITIISAAACDDNPVEPQLPIVAIGEPIFRCGRWVPGKQPATSSVVLDVATEPDTAHGLEAPPLPARLTQIEAAGGVVLRAFHISRARIRIAIDSVPSLYERHIIREAFSVPDSAAHGLTVLVLSSEPIDDKATRALAEIGARVREIFHDPTMAVMHIDDKNIPQLRAFRGIYYVGPESWSCVHKNR